MKAKKLKSVIAVFLFCMSGAASYGQDYNTHETEILPENVVSVTFGAQ